MSIIHTSYSSNFVFLITVDDEGPPPAAVDTANRPPSPAISRDGSVTPTPEDIDTDEPLTPRKTAEGI